jgi:ribonuclease-3 family protein
VFELLVRERLAAQGSMPAHILHKKAVKKVCAVAQARGYDRVEPLLTDEELGILKRGRNANSTHVPRSCDPSDYRKATGVEALFGYLYLKGDLQRLETLYEQMEDDGTEED